MDAVTMTEAARQLNVSIVKIRHLVREGVLPARENPLDKREKLIPLTAVRALAGRGRRPEYPWPRSIGIISDPSFQSEDAETYMEINRER